MKIASGSDIMVNGTIGNVTGNEVDFTFSIAEYSGFYVATQAEGTLSETTISGTMSGVFGSCNAADHRFAFYHR